MSSPFSVVMVHDTLCYSFSFLEIPEIVHCVSLVSRYWREIAVHDALWETLFFRDTEAVVQEALTSVIENPQCDPELAKAGLIHDISSPEARLEHVQWAMLHPHRHHHKYSSLPVAARAKDLLAVVGLVQQQCQRQGSISHLYSSQRIDLVVPLWGTVTGLSALHCAAAVGHVSIAKYLISQDGVEVDRRTEDAGYTPLHIATMCKRSKMVSCLIHAGANVDGQDSDKWTPLHFACANRWIDGLQQLLDAGADIEAEDAEGGTPRTRAERWGHRDVLDVLVGHLEKSSI